MKISRWIFIGSLLVSSRTVLSSTDYVSLSYNDTNSNNRALLEPCVNQTTQEKGFCMFAVECVKSNGRHVGICMRGLYFGSCCIFDANNPSDPAMWTNLPRIPILLDNIESMAPYDKNWTQFNEVIPYKPSKNGTVLEPLLQISAAYSSVSKPTATSASSKNSTWNAISPASVTDNNKATGFKNKTVISNVIKANTTSNTATNVLETQKIDLSTSAPHNTSSTEDTITLSAIPFPSSAAVNISTIYGSTSTTTMTTVIIQAVMALPLEMIGSSTLERIKSKDNQTACGKPAYRWPRIVSGEKAHPGQWPWQMSVQERIRGSFMHKCGASLLNRRWALTAGHCLYGVHPDKLLVRFGGIDLTNADGNLMERRIEYIVHPKFNPRTRQNDVSLVRLVEAVDYQPNVLPVCLPEPNTDFNSKISYVSGWGRTEERGPTSDILQYVAVPVINNTECQQMYSTLRGMIQANQICAGYPFGQKDACEGDSGGPMIVQMNGRWILAGITSFGVGCARPNAPGVSTRVTEFLDWIYQNISSE